VFSVPTAPSERSTLSLHDALPISGRIVYVDQGPQCRTRLNYIGDGPVEPPRCLGSGRLPAANGFSITPSGDMLYLPLAVRDGARSEEHTSELQSRENLVCRLLLEK